MNSFDDEDDNVGGDNTNKNEEEENPWKGPKPLSKAGQTWKILSLPPRQAFEAMKEQAYIEQSCVGKGPCVGDPNNIDAVIENVKEKFKNKNKKDSRDNNDFRRTDDESGGDTREEEDDDNNN